MISHSSFTGNPIVLSPISSSVSSKPSSRYYVPPLAAAATDHKRRPPIRPAMATVSCNSLYEVLGIPAEATGQEIKAAYRRLARVYHPDVVSVSSSSSAGDFMRIHAAYSTLSDPNKRAAYDGQLLRGRRRPLTAVVGSSGSGYRGSKNWETDQCW